MRHSRNQLPMRRSEHKRLPARLGRSSHRGEPASRRHPKAEELVYQPKDLSRLAARVAYLEEVLGLAEEPVRIIRIG